MRRGSRWQRSKVLLVSENEKYRIMESENRIATRKQKRIDRRSERYEEGLGEKGQEGEK